MDMVQIFIMIISILLIVLLVAQQIVLHIEYKRIDNLKKQYRRRNKNESK